MNIFNIPTFKICDPFFVESQIISVQRLWRFKKYHKNKYIICKSISKLKNYYDPISLNYFFECGKLININKDEVIKIDDVELNLPNEVTEARKYQYNLLKS